MNTFPLHKLPNGAIILVLEVMEIYEQLAYSLCSKNAKKYINSLNLDAYQINIRVVDSIEVEVRVQNLFIRWSSMEHNNYFPDNQIIVHEGIQFTRHIRNEGRTIDWKWDFETWNFPNFCFKDWLHHFSEMLHHPRIDYFDFSGENLDDNFIEPIQEVVKGFQIGCLSICEELTNDFAKKVLKSFTIYEKLYLDQIPFGSHELNKLLVQNLKSLCIPEAQRLKIDQVLASNSLRIQLNHSKFNEKDFNRLLKLWIRGSNPRLKYFYTMGQPRDGSFFLDKNQILKGIKYEQVPSDSEEVYGDWADYYYQYTKLAGGSRIWRYDGTTAVIVLRGISFKFIVD